MRYKAENVDTDKALDYIESCRKGDAQKELLEVKSVQKFHEGVRHGLDIAEGIFECCNYEKQGTPASYDDCVGSAISEIGKAIDVRVEDILKVGKDGRDICAKFAERILAVFERKDGTDNMRNTVGVSNGKTQI